LGPKIETLRAEFAFEWASPGRLYGKGLEISVFVHVQQSVAGPGQPLEVAKSIGAVELPQTSVFRIGEHLPPYVFPFADAHGVAVFGRLVAVEGHVGASHDDGQTPLPETVGDVVSPEGIDRPDRNGHQIGRGGEVYSVELLVQKLHLPVGWGERRQIRQGEWDDLALVYLDHRPFGAAPVVGRLDDEEFLSHGQDRQPSFSQRVGISESVRAAAETFFSAPVAIQSAAAKI